MSAKYSLEYGIDSLELHSDAIKPNERVLIIDDLLATGGTSKAVGDMVKKLRGNIESFAFLINLTELNGDSKLFPHKVFSIIDY